MNDIKRESRLGCYIIAIGLVLVAAWVLWNLGGLIFGGGFDP